MDTKPTIKNFLIAILPAILTVFLIFFVIMPVVKENREENVGGQKDQYGCLGPAGYSWDEEASACLRSWEVKGDGPILAVKIAVEHLSWQEDATVIGVVQAKCMGCFVVKLENNSNNDRKTVTLDNWQIKETSWTPAECQKLGGEPLNIVSGATCPQGEENVGEVTGFISPNVCCVPVTK